MKQYISFITYFLIAMSFYPLASIAMDGTSEENRLFADNDNYNNLDELLNTNYNNLTMVHNRLANASFDYLLLAAIQDNYPYLVARLPLTKADINTQIPPTGETMLMKVAELGRTRIVELLLNHNANPNMLSFQAETALMKAAEQGHEEIVQLLLRAHASKQETNYAGMTALNIACYALTGGIDAHKRKALRNIVDQLQKAH